MLCRTTRGVETGVVLQRGDADPSQDPAAAPSSLRYDGTLLRRMTPEDELLWARLERNREEAFHACLDLLGQRQLDATLVDVEQLFDGQSIFFYFLGDVTPEIGTLTHELANAYESKVQFRQFADAVERGCGPDCGTEAAAGCGSEGGCATCAIANACGSKAAND